MLLKGIHPFGQDAVERLLEEACFARLSEMYNALELNALEGVERFQLEFFITRLQESRATGKDSGAHGKMRRSSSTPIVVRRVGGGFNMVRGAFSPPSGSGAALRQLRDRPFNSWTS